MTASLGRLILYTRKIDDMAAFYCRYFGYTEQRLPGDRIIELCPPGNGMTLLLHLAAKGQKQGQSLVKLVFDVPDVTGFCDRARANGLQFGAIHQADGYVFANAKDPSGNSISVSGRLFATRADKPAG